MTLLFVPYRLSGIGRRQQAITAAAEGIEKRGKKWEHEHLADKVQGFRSSPGFSVFNQQHEKK